VKIINGGMESWKNLSFQNEYSALQNRQVTLAIPFDNISQFAKI
jgi:hypothetical protein